MLVCITGLPGSGKTSALTFIKKQGFSTFAMDNYIHQIYQKNKEGYRLIKNEFGKKFVGAKEVNRKALGKLVLYSDKQLKRLNKLTLPLMAKKLQALKNTKKLIFIEMGVFLLHVKYFIKYFKYVVLIKTNKSLLKNNSKQKTPHIRFFTTKIVGKLNSSPTKNSLTPNFVIKNDKKITIFQNNILIFLQNFKK